MLIALSGAMAFVLAMLMAGSAAQARHERAIHHAAPSNGVLGENLTLAGVQLAAGVGPGPVQWGGAYGNVPVAVSGLGEVAEVAGENVALLKNGTVMTWGNNESGTLGNGTRTNSQVPVQVCAVGVKPCPQGPYLSGVAAIAAGNASNYALLTNGTVVAWGLNTDGALGDALGSGISGGPETCGNAGACSTIPVEVSKLTEVVAVAAGDDDALALLKNGSVKAWGYNQWGQLGDGSTNESNLPVAVSGLTEVAGIAAGGYAHSLAVLKSGAVRAWGYNADGELGNGTTTNSDVPVNVPGLTEVSAVAAGSTHSLALLKNHTVKAWGGNEYGQLGNGMTTNSLVPLAVSGLSEVAAVAGRSWDSYARLTSGTAVAWGNNGSGQLGNGTDTNSAVPVAVDALSEVTDIAAGLAIGVLAPLPTVTKIEPADGPATGGTSVTVTGTNFSGVTAVKFGASAAAFTVNSETSITATAPAGAGIVDVTITTAGGTSATSSADRFSYAPTVTKVEPASGPAAGGTSVTISGTDFNGVSAVKFGSTNATSFKVETESLITAVSPQGTGPVDVTVTTAGGTSATSGVDQFNYGPSVTEIRGSRGADGGGTPVTIIGSKFIGVTAVRFGSINATSFTVNSSTSITAISPPGTGGVGVDITVTTPEGTSPTSRADLFGYFFECEEGHAPVVNSVTPSSGPTGTSVKILGERFFVVVCTSEGRSTRRVLFGTTEASFKMGKEGELTAVVPPGTGTVDVRVEAAGISPVALSDQFTHTAPLPPTVAKVEPNHGPAPGGTAVTITGTHFTGATAVHFGSTSATSLKVESEASITAVAPAGKGTNDVTVTTEGGTSATTSADQFTYGPTYSMASVFFCLCIPTAVAADSKGHLFVADWYESRVQEYGEAGEYLGQLGSAGSGSGQYNQPRGIAVDSKGNVWVADEGNARAEEFNEAGGYVGELGSAGSGPGQFQFPSGVAVDATGNVWVSDLAGSVQEFNEKGKYVGGVGSFGSGPGQFESPTKPAVDAKGDLWVADTFNHRVQEFNEKGEYLGTFGSNGAGAGQLSYPDGVAVDSQGDVYVADIGNGRVEEFTERGEPLATLGSFLSGPTGVAVDSKGNVWACEEGLLRVEKWTGVP